MSLLQDFKDHSALAILFLGVGFTSGLGAYEYISGIFHTDVVLQNSYIFKTDIEKTHVPLERYNYISEELKLAKSENEKLKIYNAKLLESQSSMSSSVCQRYALEVNSISNEQKGVEKDIQNALSPYNAFNKKADYELIADSKKVEEMRKYSAQLNQQISLLREKMASCIK